jgi:hypothetical protein
MEATFPVPQSLCNVNGQQLTIAEAFGLRDTNIATPVMASALGKTLNDHSYPGPLEMPLSSKNSCQSLVATVFLSTPSQDALIANLKAADVNLTPVADQGVSIITLDKDSVVSPDNFDVLRVVFPNKLKNHIRIDQNNLQVLSAFSEVLGKAIFIPTDHGQAPTYEFLYALNIFNSF